MSLPCLRSNLSLASPRQSVDRHVTSSLRTYGQGVISDSSKSCTCGQPSHVGLHPVPQQYVPLLLSIDGPVLLAVEELWIMDCTLGLSLLGEDGGGTHDELATTPHQSLNRRQRSHVYSSQSYTVKTLRLWLAPCTAALYSTASSGLLDVFGFLSLKTIGPWARIKDVILNGLQTRRR